ncbi:hypothetical protein EIN_061120 [Entamoeba invadens IP1]|uniref:hypothetical protein n=1 Tax=Entamoeba invadens IP1 TaxID=370355 RepID=UPI0002C3CF59|nr:hypothetical protein EIN_061120 [Entamoeba invadens IP1]ELP93547.1 hypothetical protein EIN_061120 [Entamoeba invadens IP1]|eukprot:XP_004260318.1 hypothetical protein EIN_061120 [Entamoeba invadens IP1]
MVEPLGVDVLTRMTTQLDEKSRDDSSCDDASAYIQANNSHLSTSFELLRYEENDANDVRNGSKKKEVISWLHSCRRGKSTKKMMVCGTSSEEVVKGWLKESNVHAEIKDFDNFISTTAKEFKADVLGFYIVKLESIDFLIDRIGDVEHLKAQNVIFCCNSVKRCPNNQGDRFSKIIKKIVLK